MLVRHPTRRAGCGPALVAISSRSATLFECGTVMGVARTARKACESADRLVARSRLALQAV